MQWPATTGKTHEGGGRRRRRRLRRPTPVRRSGPPLHKKMAEAPPPLASSSPLPPSSIPLFRLKKLHIADGLQQQALLPAKEAGAITERAHTKPSLLPSFLFPHPGASLLFLLLHRRLCLPPLLLFLIARRRRRPRAHKKGLSTAHTRTTYHRRRRLQLRWQCNPGALAECCCSIEDDDFI